MIKGRLKMKRLVLSVVACVGFVGSVFAWSPVKHDLSPQYRVWKSSCLDVGNYTAVQIATHPIIFHCVIGSGTVGQGGDSAFTLFQDTGMVAMSAVASTRAIIPLDSSSGNSSVGDTLDILITTHSYYNKSGGGRIQYLWDYLNPGAGFNRYPND